MNNHEKRKLIHEVTKLSPDVHRQIFELIMANNIDFKFSSNHSTTFVDLSCLDNSIIVKIDEFVKLCKKNDQYNKDHDRLIKQAENNIGNIFGENNDEVDKTTAIKITVDAP